MSVVVVTGASAGLGRAIAIEFGRRGDRVALLARGRDGLATAARSTLSTGSSTRSAPSCSRSVAGETTAATILANRVAPGLLDRYLARTGASSQLTEQPRSGRASYLWEPVPGDHGVRGGFGDRAHARSVRLSSRSTAR